MNIKARARKILNPMGNYHSLEGQPVPDYLPNDLLAHNEECIGVYENSEGNYVLITDFGLSVISGTVHASAPFKDIEEVIIPNKDKLNVEQVQLRMIGNKSILVPIKHGNGKFKDVYEFIRFIDRVLDEKG